MRKTLFILTHEVYIITSRASFWTVLLLPVISILLFLGVEQVKQRQPALIRPANNPFQAVDKMLKLEPDARPQGYVDPNSLVRVYPEGLPTDTLIAYPDQTSARKALDAGEISVYYVISANYRQSGQLTVYMPEYKLMGSTDNPELESLISYNLLGGNEALFHSIAEPVSELEKESLAPPGNAIRENNSQAALNICIVVMLLFFSGIMGSSTLLLNSLTSEKENRVIEILLGSASPLQMLMGKIAGLGLIGLAQMLIWTPGTVVLLRLSGSTFKLPEELMLQPSFIGWGILFFLLGYLVYAAIMAAVGALVPNLREASQVTTLVMSPMLVCEILAPVIILDPHGTLAVVFSLFPLTAPFMMMMRLALVEVPPWQLLLSAALLAAAALLVIRMAAGLFRAQTIMTGKRLRFSAILNYVRTVLWYHPKANG